MKKFTFLALGLLMMAVSAQAKLVKLNEIKSNGAVYLYDGDTLKGALDEDLDVKLLIRPRATIVINGVTILGNNHQQCPWAGLNCEGNAKIIVRGTNTIHGYYAYYPGIHIPGGYTLTIEGPGTLRTLGGRYAAGIGGGWKGTDGYDRYHEVTCGKIVIAGGTMIAEGGEEAAGIGGGRNNTCEGITIKPETDKIEATRGAIKDNNNKPYCIGAGAYGTCGYLKMNGKDYVDASSSKYGVSSSDNTYTYKGWTGDLSAITISDKDVRNGSTITGTLSKACKITIPDGYTVYLEGATIQGTDNSDYLYAALNCEGDATIILKGSNYMKGFFQYYPGIYVPKNKTLTIKGTGTLYAYSNGTGAGIGGGYGVSCGNIYISGGTIYATGGLYAAGIGGGYNSSCGTIKIVNGVTYLKATHGNYGQHSVGAGGQNATCTGVYVDGKNYGAGIADNPFIYPTSQGIEEIIADAPQMQGKKIIYNGQVLIIKGNKAFNLLGQEIK